MQTNAQIRIYRAGIYLFKGSDINSRARCEICLKLTKTSKRRHQHENIQKHRWRSVFIVNFEQIPYLFLSISFLNLGKCCRLGLPSAIKWQRSKYCETCKGRYKIMKH